MNKEHIQQAVNTKSPFEELGKKISQLLEKYNAIRDENRKLKEELATLKNSLEDKTKVIEKLKEEEELRTMEIEDINKKIMSLLS